jgi:UDP-N-acetylmuramoylalanine--D-glutamate ligase
VTVLVEGFAPDAVAVARLLAGEGRAVRLAGPGPGLAAHEAQELTALGVAIEPLADLDHEPGPADIAYLDVWTPETAPRVRVLRERGCRLSCSAELVVERARALVLGVTGTAGKSTTAAFAVQLLRASGLDVLASETGHLGNLWATAGLLDAVAAGVPSDVVVLELTSSHLAFMRVSPAIAVITAFWPDHLELHGSLEAYRRAKETIVRSQRAEDVVVVRADDPAVASFAELTQARRVSFSATREVDEGAFLRSGRVVVRAGGEHELGPAPAGALTTLAALAASAATVAAGASPESLAGRLGRLSAPPHRATLVARVAGAEVVDDGMAATPSKARAALRGRPDGSVVLLAGGLESSVGGRVHASAEERELLAAACDEAGRAVRLAVLFGPAAAQLEPLLRDRGVPLRMAGSFEEAVRVALAAAPGAATVLLSPMFPLPTEDRRRFAALVRGS